MYIRIWMNFRKTCAVQHIAMRLPRGNYLKQPVAHISPYFARCPRRHRPITFDLILLIAELLKGHGPQGGTGAGTRAEAKTPTAEDAAGGPREPWAADCRGV